MGSPVHSTEVPAEELKAAITPTEPQYALALYSSDSEELVRIEKDGTVIISKEGADKEAAKTFYESLQFEGKSLYQKIAELEAENATLKAQIKSENY